MGVGEGAGVERASGIIRGAIGTPARSSTGPCGAGVGVGVGLGNWKPLGEPCARTSAGAKAAQPNTNA